MSLQRGVMITFNIIKERNGWTIRTDSGMATPFRTRSAAVREAECLAKALRGHGQYVEVVVDHIGFNDERVARSSLQLTASNIFLQNCMTGVP